MTRRIYTPAVAPVVGSRQHREGTDAARAALATVQRIHAQQEREREERRLAGRRSLAPVGGIIPEPPLLTAHTIRVVLGGELREHLVHRPTREEAIEFMCVTYEAGGHLVAKGGAYALRHRRPDGSEVVSEIAVDLRAAAPPECIAATGPMGDDEG